MKNDVNFYLSAFYLNVDKSFVDDIGKNQNNEAIILKTLSIAKPIENELRS